jgi:enterochelin esterase-like enzyme
MQPSDVLKDRAGSSAPEGDGDVEEMTMFRKLTRRLPRWIARSWRDGVSAVATCAVIVVIAAVLGSALRDWAVGLGMDDERSALIAALLEVVGGATLVTLALARTGSSRLGAMVGMLVVEVVPFLQRAGHTATPPGLTARVDVAQWVLQPLGMLLLGFIAACIGAGLGLMLHRDLVRGWHSLRRRPLLGIVPVAAITLTAVSLGAALTALQSGPVSALYSYEFNPSAISNPTPSPAAHTAGPAVAATQTQSPFVAGHQETLTVDGRSAVVYVPGGRASDGDPRYQVVYLLHGYPSNPDAAISSLQVGGVVDQLVATHQLYPTLVVVPDGNGSASSDAEWGDTANGNSVETWLTTRVVPAIDAHYNTFGANFRGIAGYSAGGFGAVNLALRHPDLFRWAGSWSGYFEARSDIFGANAAANSPSTIAHQLSSEQRMPIYLGAGTDDRYFLNDTARFHDQLISLGWPNVQNNVVPGGHSMEAWRDQMARSLLWLDKLWNGHKCPHTGQTPRSCGGTHSG